MGLAATKAKGSCRARAAELPRGGRPFRRPGRLHVQDDSSRFLPFVQWKVSVPHPSRGTARKGLGHAAPQCVVQEFHRLAIGTDHAGQVACGVPFIQPDFVGVGSRSQVCSGSQDHGGFGGVGWGDGLFDQVPFRVVFVTRQALGPVGFQQLTGWAVFAVETFGGAEEVAQHVWSSPELVEVVVGGPREVSKGVVLELHRAVGGIHDLLQAVIHRPGVLAGAFFVLAAKRMLERTSVLVAL